MLHQQQLLAAGLTPQVPGTQMLELQNYYPMPTAAPTVIPHNVFPIQPITKKQLTRSSSKISNITNSNDTINARIFVGNLNTFVITKDDVEAIFQRYGPLEGISMHKGYAFIQYTCEDHARNAVKGEDQRIYASQALDANMAAEPKPNRASRKRPLSMLTKNIVDTNVLLSMKSAKLDMSGLPGLMTPMSTSHQTLMSTPMSISSSHNLMPSSHNLMYLSAGAPLSYNPLAQVPALGHTAPQFNHSVAMAAGEDIIMTSSCMTPSRQQQTRSVVGEYKTTSVKLQQHQDMEEEPCQCSKGETSRLLACATCNAEFSTSWQIIQHCQYVHNINIFIEKQVVQNGPVDSQV